MSLFDPAELGWQEFWLRIGAAVLALGFTFTALLFVGRIILLAFDAAQWVVRKINGKEEEMSLMGLQRAVLKLVPTSQRSAAEKLLKRLLAAYSKGCEVYVAEYDGKPASVHVSPDAAFAVCARYLSDEPGKDIPWDWFEDEYGWVMRRLDLNTDRALSLLGGKVTRTEVEG